MESGVRVGSSMTEVNVTIESNMSHFKTTDSAQSSVKAVIGMILTAINFMTISGNTLVLLSVAFNKRLRSVTYSFVVSLAIADLLLGLIVLPFSTALQIEKTWYFGQTFCSIWAAVDVLCCTASIYSLCAISIDRYIGVSKPLHHRSIMSRKKAWVAIATIWILSLGISIGPLIGWKETSEPSKLNECAVTTNIGYVLFSVVTSFYIPAITTVIIYTKIYDTAVKQSEFLRTGVKGVKCSNGQPESSVLLRAHSGRKLLTPTSSSVRDSTLDKDGEPQTLMSSMYSVNDDKKNQWPSPGKELILKTKIKFNKEKKAAKTLGIVVGVFLLCWFPFFFILPLGAVCSTCKVPTALFDSAFWLGYCNSMLNPLIYAVWNKEFRGTFAAILQCAWCIPGSKCAFTNRQPANIGPLR